MDGLTTVIVASLSLVGVVVTAVLGFHGQRSKADEERDRKQRRTIRVQDDYIGVLRKQINDEVGPPPAPWPDDA